MLVPEDIGRTYVCRSEIGIGDVRSSGVRKCHIHVIACRTADMNTEELANVLPAKWYPAISPPWFLVRIRILSFACLRIYIKEICHPSPELDSSDGRRRRNTQRGEDAAIAPKSKCDLQATRT